MKTLKFKPHLIDQILNGSKTVTWRLFDDKNLTNGDMFEIIDASTSKSKGEAVIVEVKEKKLGEVTDEDYDYSGYKKENQSEMLEHYKDIYGDKVGLDTVVKMIKFRMI